MTFAGIPTIFRKSLSALLAAATVMLSLLGFDISGYKESSFAESLRSVASPAQNSSVLSPDTQAAVELIAATIFRQMFFADADRTVVRKTLESMPMLSDIMIGEVPVEVGEQVVAASPDLSFESFRNWVRFAYQEFSNGLNNFTVCFSPTQFENLYAFRGHYFLSDGTERAIETGVYFDRTSGMIIGTDNKGIFGIGFEYCVDSFLINPSSNPWMREYGYNLIYDFLAPSLGMDFDTVRVRFSYGGRHWMIQLWKGFYTGARGAEMGLYYIKDGDLPGFYTCVGDDDMIDMSMTLRDNRDGKVYFSRPEQKHWWLSGFYLSPYASPYTMTLEGTLGFPDEGMCAAFTGALDRLPLSDVKYTVSGAEVSFVW